MARSGGESNKFRRDFLYLIYRNSLRPARFGSSAGYPAIDCEHKRIYL